MLHTVGRISRLLIFFHPLSFSLFSLCVCLRLYMCLCFSLSLSLCLCLCLSPFFVFLLRVRARVRLCSVSLAHSSASDLTVPLPIIDRPTRASWREGAAGDGFCGLLCLRFRVLASEFESILSLSSSLSPLRCARVSCARSAWLTRLHLTWIWHFPSARSETVSAALRRKGHTRVVTGPSAS